MADDTLVLIDVLLPARFDNYSELTHAAREPPGRRLDRTRLLGYSTTVSLGREHACAAHRLDLLLGQLGELLGLDNQRPFRGHAWRWRRHVMRIVGAGRSRQTCTEAIKQGTRGC